MKIWKVIPVLFLLMLFVMANSTYATNVKITSLVEETTPIATDLVGAMVDDPGGTPISKKVTFANLFNSTANIGASTIVTTGAVDSGSITSNFGAIDNGASNITTTGDITGGTHAATSDTAANDNASIGYTVTEGLILTGQGSTNDITIKNDADATVLSIPTGTTNVDIVGDTTASTFAPDGDTSASDTAAIGFTATEGIVITGQGSVTDVTIKNDADVTVISIATGTTTTAFAGTITASSGSWDTGGIDIATSDTYAINGTNVIDNATTLSSGMVASSLTSVGALNSGSITSGFGNINNGASTITTTGVITGGSASMTVGTITIADGGTVTQTGSKATTVTLNTNSGQVTTHNASLSGGSEVTFTVLNSVVTALDVIILSISDSPDVDSEVIAFINDVTSGAFDILLSNVSGSEDTGAIVINFIVFRGASS